MTHIRNLNVSFVKHMGMILDPKLNNIQVFKHNNLPGNKQEVWLSGKVLFLHIDFVGKKFNVAKI